MSDRDKEKREGEEEEEEEFQLLDTTKPARPTKLMIAYEDTTIQGIREEIRKLNARIDRIHWINTAARIGWIAFNPTFHFQNFSKDALYRGAFFVAKQFMS